MGAFNVILNILILVGMIILSVLAKVYLPSYLKKKGENLATKEDIGQITREIEKARSQYTSELERLKADLKLVIEQRSRLQEKSHEALVEFFENCICLEGDKLNINLGDLPIDGGKSLFDYQNSMDKLFRKTYSDYHRLLLYFKDDAQVVRCAGDLLLSVMEIRKVFKEMFPAAKISLIKEGEAYMAWRVENIQDRTDFRSAVAESDVAAKVYYEKMNPARYKMCMEFGKYLQALNRYFESLGQKTVLESVRGSYG